MVIMMKHPLTNAIKGFLNEMPINPRSDLLKKTLSSQCCRLTVAPQRPRPEQQQQQLTKHNYNFKSNP